MRELGHVWYFCSVNDKKMNWLTKLLFTKEPNSGYNITLNSFIPLSFRKSRQFHRLSAVKHSKSFAVANADGGSMEDLRETARRLTSDSSFRRSVYQIIARKDASNKTGD